MALTGYIKNGDKFEKIGVSDNIPVGLILPWFLNKDVPVGFIRVLDTWYDSATYPTLDAMYGDTYGRQNGKFRLPPVWDNRFLEGGSIAGELKDAGLPNIKGSTYIVEAHTSYMGLMNNNGCIGAEDSGVMENANGGYDQGGNRPRKFVIDASLSNDTYGKSNTVQPKAITVVWIIKAFEGASPSSTDIEITNVANEVVELQSKINHINEVDYSAGVDCVSGFVVPCNGVICVSYRTIGNDINLFINNIKINYANASNLQFYGFMTGEHTVSKDDVVTLTGAGEKIIFSFFPYKGV